MLTNTSGIPPHLTKAELERYARDGFLVRTAVFTNSELPVLQEAVESAAQRALCLADEGKTYWLDNKRFVDIDSVINTMTVQFEHTPTSNTIRVIEPVHHLHPILEQLIDEKRITGPIRDILGCTRISVWTNKLNLKRPYEGSGFGWHQDSPYWIHNSPHVDLLPNVMVTLDDASIDNGCFQVIRGSHKNGLLPGTDDGSQLGGFFTDPACFDLACAVPMQVPAGSLVFFSPHSVHGSGPNQSPESRRALVLTYQPADFPMLKTGTIRNVPEIAMNAIGE
ncbi:MAG: phytanoyl-CoA dioxygenase family protein [Pseudomonadales bacterium]